VIDMIPLLASLPPPPSRLSPEIPVKAYVFFGEQWAISASLPPFFLAQADDVMNGIAPTR
jgi:hypothetical protein